MRVAMLFQWWWVDVVDVNSMSILYKAENLDKAAVSMFKPSGIEYCPGDYEYSK